VRDALYADVVDKQWFARRPTPRRSRWWWIASGWRYWVSCSRLLLAFTVGHALLGLAVVIAAPHWPSAPSRCPLAPGAAARCWSRSGG